MIMDDMSKLIERGRAYETALRGRNDEMSMAGDLVGELVSTIVQLNNTRNMLEEKVEILTTALNQG